jgi:hypothetical protein
MAQEMGKLDALMAGDIHEDCDSAQPEGEAAMNKANNRSGVVLSGGMGGKTDRSAECAKAARDGSLQTSPGGTDPNY